MASKHPELAGELVARCFHARTVAHILHLKAKSYAAHIALNEFYDEIIPLADTFAEQYQGDYGLIESYNARFQMYPDGPSLLEALGSWIADNRHDICDEDDTYLQAAIDDIVSVIRGKAYKLKFLR